MKKKLNNPYFFSRLIIERERKQKKKKSDFNRRFHDNVDDEPESAETRYDFSKYGSYQQMFDLKPN